MDIRSRLKVWMIEGAIRKDGLRRKIVMREMQKEVDNIMEQDKKWWKSKTIIFNLVSGLVAIGASMQGHDLPPNVEKMFASLVMIGNVILRFVTNTSVEKSVK